jgi:para-nitrobenzyl esterase
MTGFNKDTSVLRYFFASTMFSMLLSNSTGAAADAEIVRTGVVQINDGPIRGYKSEGVDIFLGIPYAAPPVGALRWMPPQPVDPWRKVLDALAFGNTCVQTNTLGGFAAPSNHEDCLYLNVFAPPLGDDDKDGHDEGSRKRPVMVWIYGGGNFDGESNDYDARKLARDGGVVVVSLNYRLNVFGFLAHPALDSEGHAAANYGLMDQQFALRWVQRNIAAFGGDPRNVTIFGESAGGVNVMANMASPTAKGLFHRGIVESRAVRPQPTLAQAEAVGTAFAAAVGCLDQTAACLRSLSVQEIIGNGSNFLGAAPSPAGAASPTLGIIDGTILTQSTTDALKSGQFNQVPVINGTNRDEWRWFVGQTELATGHIMTAADYPDSILGFFGATNGPLVLAQYPLAAYNSPSEAFAAAVTAGFIACPARRINRLLVKYVPTYGYEFADETAPSSSPPVSFPYGTAHTYEIQYLFPHYHGATGIVNNLNPAQERLSDQMVSYWTTFAKSGNPNSEETPDWPRYDATLDQYQSLQLPIPFTTSAFAGEHDCDFWDSLQ